MPDSNVGFVGSIPENYDRHMGPTMFEPYAADLARRVIATAPKAVLEVACGTGILTQRLRDGLAAGARLVATDLNPPMIDYARGKTQAAAPIEWQPADAALLPFPDASFDAVACQFGIMFVPDKAVAVREAHRVLRKGGLFALNVWDSMEHNPHAKIAYDVIAGFFPNNPPKFFDIPYGFHDHAVLGRLMAAHGFGSIAIEAVILEAKSVSARSLATGMVQGSPYRNAIQERGGDFARIVDAVTDALAKLGGAKPFRCGMRAVIVTTHAE